MRNIVSLRTSENLFDDLSDDADAQQAAVRLEIDTKPPHYTINTPIINRPYEEAAFIEAIDFPFLNWAKSRFSNGRFGIWYGADTITTSIYETVYHWRRMLADAGYDTEGSLIERKVWLVRCDSALVDFRPTVDEYPLLVNKVNYDFTQDVGSRLHHEGHPGLVSISARCKGDVYGILNRDVLSDPRNACYLSYRINNGHTEVEREPGHILTTIE